MNDLPFEVRWQIALNVSRDTIFNLCKSHQTFQQICRKPTFWREKYEKDFNRGKRLDSTYLQRRDILNWKTLYLYSCNIGRNYPSLEFLLTPEDLIVMDLSTNVNDDLELIRELVDADNHGLVIRQKCRNVPLTNSYAIAEQYPDDTPASLSRSSDPQIRFEDKYRGQIIDDPRLVTDLLQTGDSLVIYLFTETPWAAIVTKTVNGYTWTYRKHLDAPI
jgi:hypothetical protein